MSGGGTEVLLFIFVLVWLVIAVLKCCSKSRSEQTEQNERLAQVREERIAARREAGNSGAVGAVGANVSAQEAIASTPEPSAPPVDITQSRIDVIKANLFFRKLENADSVRTLSAVLAAANDRAGSGEGSVIARTWHAAEGSVRRMVEGPSTHECCICLDGYEAGESVCWSKEDDCDHIFHEDCIMAWLKDNDDCPLCRAKLVGHRTGGDEEEA